MLIQEDSGQYQCDPSASYPQHVNVHVIDTGTDNDLQNGGFEKCDSLKPILEQILQIVLNIHRSSRSLLNNDKNKHKWLSPGPHQLKLNYLAKSG